MKDNFMISFQYYYDYTIKSVENEEFSYPDTSNDARIISIYNRKGQTVSSANSDLIPVQSTFRKGASEL